MTGLARDNHYVPQSYMRRWAHTGRAIVWSYRTLVPRVAEPLWVSQSTQRIAVRRDLYTSVADGQESDRIETWLNREVETPATSTIEKLCSGDAITTEDRRHLARYIAALDCRSPVAYATHTRLLAEQLPGILNATIESAIDDIRDKLTRGEPLVQPPVEFRSHSIGVSMTPAEDDAERTNVNVSVVIGREQWLDSIENVVNNVSRILDNHDWRVIRPHAGWRWVTSDKPVLRLNYFANGEYNFDGRYGDPGTEIVLPLSPEHMLYTHVGHPIKRIDEFSLQQTVLLNRFVAESAYRWIIAREPVQNAVWSRPRVVDLRQYNFEESERIRYHEEQANAEFGLRDMPRGEVNENE